MNMSSRPLLLSASIALIMAANGAVAADTVSQDVTEARQETQIWTTYALSPYLRANDLKVSVHNGKATLSGRVEEGVNKDLAKQIALGVSGIKEVDNQIIVQSEYMPPAHATERSYGEVIDDATITASVKSKLLWSKYTSGLTTDVDTKARKVTLIGTADSPAARELAGELAKNTRDVVSVDNQLVVKTAKPAAGEATRNAGRETNTKIADSWITTKVKSTFLYSSNVDGADISVKTTGGIVTLSGKVNSGAQRALAIKLAQNVRGVESVHSTDLVL